MSKNKDNYSYSKVSTYHQCPFKYKLKYVDKNFFYTSQIATEFGTLIHKTEETIGNCIIDGKPIDYIALKNSFILKAAELEAKFPEYNSPDKSGKTYKEKAKLYLDTCIYYLETFLKNNPNWTLVGCEISFKQKYDELHEINGSIDRLFYDKAANKYMVQDIKSWPVPDQAKTELKKPLQFLFYSLAVMETYGARKEDVSCSYYLPLVECSVYDANLVDFYDICTEELNKNFEGIMNEEFYPIKTALCHWCEFCNTNPNQPKGAKDLCPYHSLWTKKGDAVKESVVDWHGLAKHEQMVEEYKRLTRKEGDLRG